MTLFDLGRKIMKVILFSLASIFGVACARVITALLGGLITILSGLFPAIREYFYFGIYVVLIPPALALAIYFFPPIKRATVDKKYVLFSILRFFYIPLLIFLAVLWFFNLFPLFFRAYQF